MGTSDRSLHNVILKQVTQSHSYTARVKHVSALLANVPQFAEHVGAVVLTLLAKYAAPNMQGMHLQSTESKAVGGTCRDAVRSATRRLVVQALAQV